MENFSNSILLPAELPEIGSVSFNGLDKNYLTILLFRVLIFFLVLAGGFFTFLFLSEIKPSALILGLIIALIIFVSGSSFVLSILGFPKKGYLVREKDISYQKGLITYKLTTVPFNRIQHVEVNQGILAKLFHLSAVKIYTAGGTSSDLSIPGLPVDDAQKLKAFLSEKISEHE